MSVSNNNSSYRRGVLLGLTMAEIVILIIFLLLLAFASLLDRAKKENAAQAALLQDKPYIERIIRVFSSHPPDMAEDIVQIIEKLPDVVSLIKENKLEAAGETLDQVILRGVEKLEAEKHARESMGDAPIEQQLLAAIEKQKELEAETKNLTDQKKNLIAQIGRGVDLPPCWPDNNGRPTEYLFKIDLTNDGIVMFDSAPTHRTEVKSRLPLQKIKYGVPRNIPQFREEAAPLFHWSQQKECRFYVTIYDRTGASEKALFKQLLLTVEGYFYKNLITSSVEKAKEAPKEKEDNSFFGGLFKKKDDNKRKRSIYN